MTLREWSGAQIRATIRRPVPEVSGARTTGLYGEGTLGLIVLGRAAWSGLCLQHAVDAVVSDNLDTADTVNETGRPTSPQLVLPDATARRLADERRSADEAETRRRDLADTFDLEARKGRLLNELTDFAKAAKEDRAKLRQIRAVENLIEDAETAADLDMLEDDLEALQEARPITSDQDRSSPQTWWCSRCRRLLGPNEVDTCALCGEVDQVIPASTWMQLADAFGRSLGNVVDVRPLDTELTPVQKAYADTAARLTASYPQKRQPQVPSTSAPAAATSTPPVWRLTAGPPTPASGPPPPSPHHEVSVSLPS